MTISCLIKERHNIIKIKAEINVENTALYLQKISKLTVRLIIAHTGQKDPPVLALPTSLDHLCDRPVLDEDVL
jgi:hypothetical protein